MQNVLSSPLSNITGFEKTYVHDLIWEKIDRWSDHIALMCSVTGKSYTYSQLRKVCGKLATSLRKNNLRPRDTIAIVLPNIPELAIIVLAANEAGLCTTLVNPAYTEHEIRKQLVNADVQAVFTFPAKLADIQASIANNSKIKLPIILVNDTTADAAPISGIIKFDDLVCEDIEEFSISQEIGVDYEDTVLLPYSSGTTGIPKGIELSHKNLVANILQFSHPVVFPGRPTTKDYQDIIPVILPMFHSYALIYIIYGYLRAGAKLVCMPRFSVNEFIKLLENHQFTMLHTVPPIIQIMVSNELIKPHYIAHVEVVIVAAASIGKETIAKFQNRFKNTRFIQGYGASELSPVATCGILDTPPSSCGFLIPNTKIRIVGYEDNNLGKNLPPHNVGEIYVQGPQVMKGYYKNPEATASTMDGDWYKTGDLGYYTEDSLLYITGRLKEIIKVNGYQVAPAELEEIIRKCDKVKDVAVIGVAHDKYGEIPKAFIVPVSKENISEDEIKKIVANRVTKYKQLGYVQFITSIPKSASGKILRRELERL
ncbi:hypothetical protein DMN91_006784 [Ooceraea biroi]|uniref:4-coumarate--CoA ligase n=1 Tax=Ooceraea biroi TaxID=2015173 RepID=A0A3L8DID0_OOCBI|nr:4-coumarate--CoA ligase 1 isoform X1 [Ooceraea biroi]RLU20177.1 hypothetical protein DMN91_006784 [Ooceraea biroi]